MARLLSTALIVALLAATAAAFAVTERLKLQKSPIYGTEVELRTFSPECDCDKAVTTIRFKLRNRDRLTVWVKHNGERVGTLVSGRSFAAGPVTLAFDGLTESGISLPDGVYKPVVHLAKKHQTIELPSPTWIRIDTKPPEVEAPHRVYAHISPDGDGQKDQFRVRYSLSERGHGILIVDNRQVVRTRFQPLHGVLTWNGKIDGRTAGEGPHVLKISAEDESGNRATPFPFAVVTIRYVRLGRERVLAKPRTHFAILVLADAKRVQWLFNRGRGELQTGNGRATLRLRAPKKPGVYRLYVTANGHAAKALVTVA